ncbi:MAG TPA: hypothetical protein VD968_13710 [Pyrinomonadaceae bacterium]|nr:hypothetical protein [Pyrinomonadaceae bacterium]
MTLFALWRHLAWSRRTAEGETVTYYYTVTYDYYDEITWVVLALALAWLAWLLVRRHRRARALMRRPRRTNSRRLKRVVRVKRELSSRYLRPGFSANIHAVGVGALAGGDYCVQVFIRDANEELWAGAGLAALPPSYRGVALVPVQAAAAGFIAQGVGRPIEWEQYPNGIRGQQEVIIGGISGANTNLTGQSGTIGYFCTRKSRLPRRKEVHLLSNSHVFADLRKAAADEGDLITQPSPGEPSGNRPVGALVAYSAIKFDGDLNDPNHVDAAVAKLWGQQRHKPVIPLIGAVEGYAPKETVEPGETARKFGRTTGYTEGSVFSIHLDIWVRYDRTGQSAFFRDQLLIEPALPAFTRFVAKGDSGSLVVDERRHALGLIFAGTPDPPEAPPSPPPADGLKRIENYGVANPISEVLDRLKIELLV